MDEESDRRAESGSEQADDTEAGEGEERREEVDEYGDAEASFRLNQDAV